MKFLLVAYLKIASGNVDKIFHKNAVVRELLFKD